MNQMPDHPLLAEMPCRVHDLPEVIEAASEGQKRTAEVQGHRHGLVATIEGAARGRHGHPV